MTTLTVARIFARSSARRYAATPCVRTAARLRALSALVHARPRHSPSQSGRPRYGHRREQHGRRAPQGQRSRRSRSHQTRDGEQRRRQGDGQRVQGVVRQALPLRPFRDRRQDKPENAKDPKAQMEAKASAS